MKRIISRYHMLWLLPLLATGAALSFSQSTTETDRVKASVADDVRGYRAMKWFTSEVTGQRTHGKSIYGADGRKDIYALNASLPVEKMAIKAADSTCVLTSASRVTKRTDGSHLLQLEPYQQGAYAPCSNERFREQKTGGWCSGFLVAPDLIATAGHCCEARDEEAQQISFIFHFYAQGETVTKSEFAADEVYTGKQVVAHRLDDGGDFALIRLDRAVTAPGAVPLKVRKLGDPETKIGLIGYPSGLSAKAAFGAEVRSKDSTWLYANLDSYGGNSGSAVFNEQGLVEGILVRGRQDFSIHNNSCFYSTRYPDSDSGEVVTRGSVFADKIP